MSVCSAWKFCAGDSHTVSRVAAGLAFVDRKVILMGRNPYPPDKPGKICVRRLKENLDILNSRKVGAGRWHLRAVNRIPEARVC